MHLLTEKTIKNSRIMCESRKMPVLKRIGHLKFYKKWPHFIHPVACNLLHEWLTWYVIHDFARSVHLDARPNQARNELKCGDFWKYFFNQRIINSQARYSFRATSCTLRFMISCVACILMHDRIKHGTNKVRWFWEVFFQPTYYQPSSALFISCNKLHATICDSLRSVHLDAR